MTHLYVLPAPLHVVADVEEGGVVVLLAEVLHRVQEVVGVELLLRRRNKAFPSFLQKKVVFFYCLF